MSVACIRRFDRRLYRAFEPVLQGRNDGALALRPTPCQDADTPGEGQGEGNHMTRNRMFWVLLALWAVLYAASFIVARATAPTGDSFLRGINRLEVFAQYQAGAAIAAFVVWRLGLQFAAGSGRRWLSRVPLLMALALVLFVVGLIAWAWLSHPDPVEPPNMPVTAPATDLNVPADG